MPEQYSGMWNVLNLRRRAGDSWSQVEDTYTGSALHWSADTGLL